MRSLGIAFLALGMAGCGQTATPEEQALLGVKAYIQQNLDEFAAATVALQAAAPEPDADGWSGARDAAAVDAMKAAWRRARISYEHIEGAIAVLFSELDFSTDARYEGFLAGGPDGELFDDQGVIGVHAVERVLWSDVIPVRVREFEQGLPGYRAAAFPASEAEASAFKRKLCARLAADAEIMRAQFAPLALDPAAAFRGVIGSMTEQVEKATMAATGEEESRYAQYTLADMRANVEAGVAIYGEFRPWLLASGGAAQDAKINARFAALGAEYAALTGDALPPVPASWSAHPSEADLATPFGRLYQAVARESDPESDESLVGAMRQAADLLHIPQLP